MTHKRQDKPKWGTTDPRPVNRRPPLDPDSGLPAVGDGVSFFEGLNRAQRRARAKRQRSKRR